MNTLTFKATEEQINEVLQPLSFILHNSQQSKFIKTAIRSNLNNLLVETRVYLIDLHLIDLSTIHSNLSNDEFIDIAEEQGTVYSLNGFNDAYNTNQLDSLIVHSVIRII